MAILAPSSSCRNPSEEVEGAGKKALFGSCIVCWSAIGLLVLAGLVSMLLGPL